MRERAFRLRQGLEIDGLRKECDTQYARIVELEKQVEQLKLKLRVERQSKFATHHQQAAGAGDDTPLPRQLANETANVARP